LGFFAVFSGKLLNIFKRSIVLGVTLQGYKKLAIAYIELLWVKRNYKKEKQKSVTRKGLSVSRPKDFRHKHIPTLRPSFIPFPFGRDASSPDKMAFFFIFSLFIFSFKN
jgi:hypothetical protein